MVGTFGNTTGGTPPVDTSQGPLWRERRDVPVYQVELWPNQSLTKPGLYWFLGISAAFLIFPLVALAGTGAFWGLVPFLALAFFGIWFAIRRNAKNLRLSETLSIWSDEVRVERLDPNGRTRRWQADPVKVRVRIHKDARIEDYLTMTGGGREIELGAFLSPEERVSLADEIESALTRAIRGLSRNGPGDALRQ